MAQLKIGMAEEFLRKGPVNPKDPFPALHDIGKPELALFNKYFHSDKQPNAIQRTHLHGVRRVYDDMQTVLTESLLQAPMFGWGVGYFQPDPADGTLVAQGYVPTPSSAAGSGDGPTAGRASPATTTTRATRNSARTRSSFRSPSC